MFWQKQKAKATEEEGIEALQKLIFPGGAQEKMARAQKVIEISNGKLTPLEALDLYTKAKVRFRVGMWKFDAEGHRGRTADELIQGTMDDSGGKLSFIESVAINAYALFDITDQIVTAQVSIKEAVMVVFGADGQGFDCDEIPFAVGQFGYEVPNPIPVRGTCGIQVYFKNLRTENGEAVTFKRIGSMPYPGSSDRVDEYDVYLKDGKPLAKLFFCHFHQRISRKAPKGFKLIYPFVSLGFC